MRILALKDAASSIRRARHFGKMTDIGRATLVRHLQWDARQVIKSGIWLDRRDFRNLRTGCTNFNRSMRKHLSYEKYPYGYTLR